MTLSLDGISFILTSKSVIMQPHDWGQTIKSKNTSYECSTQDVFMKRSDFKFAESDFRPDAERRGAALVHACAEHQKDKNSLARVFSAFCVVFEDNRYYLIIAVPFIFLYSFTYSVFY